MSQSPIDRELRRLRRDFTPQLWGVLYDPWRRVWKAIDGQGRYVEAPTPDGLRRGIRQADGTATASTQAFPIAGS